MKKILLVIAILSLVAISVAIGWYLGHRDSDYDPYQQIKKYGTSRHDFLVGSSEVSMKMTDMAIEALKKKDIPTAIKDCKIAIDIFPAAAKPYTLLVKFYLMTGQEQKMFDTLTLAGHSYPNFDNIVSIIDDQNLDQLPLPEPSENIYLANFFENKKMAMSFMFDDGEANVYRALPTFEKYGYRATIPVVAGFVADTTNDPFWGSWSEWKDAANRGFEIANHSMFHRDSQKLHGDDFDVAIDQAQDLIEKNTGHPVTAFVFPHDSYNDEAVSRALKKHEAVRTSEFLRSFYDRTVDIVIGGPHVSVKTAERLVDIGIKRHLWLIAKCHGVRAKVSMRSFKSITPAFLETYLSYIHSKADNVWVDTFSHIFEYMSQRSHTTIETKNYSSTSIDFILHHTGMTFKSHLPITVIIKTPVGVKSATAPDGHSMKAWVCDEAEACIDVDAYDTDVHVQLSPSI